MLRSDGKWEFVITPEADWPAGLIGVEIDVDGTLAGTS